MLKRVIAVVVVGGLVAVLAWAIAVRVRAVLAAEPEAAADRRADRAAPVEVAPIGRGPIELVRVFSGTLESAAEVRVAAKVGGRIESISVDLADPVGPDDVVAVLDSDEFQQDLSQSQAELAVAHANLIAAQNALEIAEREMQRQTTLRDQGIASDAQFDQARAAKLAAEARVAVARAEVERADAAVKNATIRLGYTRVRASWESGGGARFVAQRMVEAGDTIAANTPLITVVQLDPIKAVLYISERDYARLHAGQKVTLSTDAYPGRGFTGEVTRVSPVFESASRQAVVELNMPNPDLLLKPGMFVRASAVLERVEDTLIVPEAAIIRRDDRSVVFVINEQQQTARMVPVEVGITNAGRAQVTGEGLEGRVVTLGQQLLNDGSLVAVAQERAGDTPQDTTTTPPAEAGAP